MSSVSTIDFSLIPYGADRSMLDYMHVMQDDADHGNLTLSYKMRVGKFSSWFESPSTLDLTTINAFASNIRNKINELSNAVNSAAVSKITKSEANSTYVRKTTVEGKIPALLTNSSMESEIAKYANSDMFRKKAAEAREAAQKLADEITDFAAAAFVGTMQANAGSSGGDGGGDGGGNN